MELPAKVSPDDQEQLERAAESIRQSAVLGRSAMLGRLFEHLLARSLAGEAPKEIEVAQELFARSGAEAINDASVRVYVHRLRRKLESYYAAEGRDEPVRIVLPKGEYRFVVESRQEDHEPAARPGGQRRNIGWRAAITLLLLLNLLVVSWAVFNRPRDDLSPVRSTHVWARMLNHDRPLLIVTGDYYIFGERAADNKVDHLVRRFDINGRDDLERLLMQRPELAKKYSDLGLSYLPIGSAGAIRSIAPIVEAASRRRLVRVVPMSELNASMITTCDIVYVGLLSGLGVLKDAVFNGSRFAVGLTYDQLIDQRTGKSYTAELTAGHPGSTPGRDYAFISSIPGPAGTHILIVAGTRDSGLQGAADIIASAGAAQRMSKVAGTGEFEALYRIDRLADENFNRTELAMSARAVKNLWDPASFKSRSIPGNGTGH